VQDRVGHPRAGRRTRRLHRVDGASVVDDGRHARCVDAWLERSAAGLAPEALLRLFEAALDGIWIRTKTTLGEITLTAIAERVLHNASERFSLLRSLKVDPTSGIRCRGLGERSGSLEPAELREAIRFVLVELLTVLGNLTAEILTPALHAEIAGVALSDALGVGKSPPRPSPEPVNPGGEEEKKSWRT
jgi:hypothetical protein